MIRSLIIDDEPIAIRVLETHLSKIPDIEVAGTFSNAVDGLQAVRGASVDLVFLDIEMPELSGIGFIKALERPPRFIFTTAHRHYAVRGFELDAIDYLLKPIGFPRLLRAIEKFRRRLGVEAGGGEENQACIHVRVDRRTVRVDLPSIRYIEGMSDYVLIHTNGGRLMTKMRLGDLEAELGQHGFARIHRSYLVPLSRIDSFTSSEVQIQEAFLPISRTYRREVLRQLEAQTA